MKKITLLFISIICCFALVYSNTIAYAKEEITKDYKNMTEEQIKQEIDKLFEKSGSDTITIENQIDTNSSKKNDVVKGKKNNSGLFSTHPYIGGDKVRLTINRELCRLTCENVTTGAVYVCNYTTSYAGYNCGNRNTIGCCQGLMNCNGATLAVDGIFGNLTYSAVINFQSRYGLDKDGIAGPKTFGIAVLMCFNKPYYL